MLRWATPIAERPYVLSDVKDRRPVIPGAACYAAAEQERLGIDAVQAARFAHWLRALLISDPRHRAAADVLARGRGGPPTLWAAGISGARPIALTTDAS